MCGVEKLNPQSALYKAILKIFPAKQFVQKFSIIHSGQIPHVGILLTAGKITLFDKTKKLEVFPGNLIAAKELISEKSIDVTITIEPNSYVSLIDKISLKELLARESVA